jgi:hypothetical protein
MPTPESATSIMMSFASLYHVIPFECKEDVEKLVKKLNELISIALTAQIKERIAMKRAKRRLKRKSREVSPGSYATMPYFFTTEQVEIDDKLRRKKKQRGCRQVILR